MSDYYPAEIHIGGLIPQKLLGKLIPKIVAEDACLKDYSGPAATGPALRTAFQKDSFVALYDDNARNGCFEPLERFLIRHRIHFDRQSSAFDDYSAVKVFYRGGAKPWVLLTDQAGAILFRAVELTTLLDQEPLSDRDKVAALRRLINPPECVVLKPIQLVKE